MNAPLTPPSGPMGFTGSRLIRIAEERGEETLAAALARRESRFYLSQAGRWLCRGPENAPDALFTAEEASGLGADLDEAVLLGWTADVLAPRLALELPASHEPTGALRPLELRAAGNARLFDADTEAHLAQAQHFLNWHRRTRFCGVCGSRTRPTLAGYRRDCAACGHAHFPRTDPVVIMLIHDGAGRCVFGRQPHFKPFVWSCLAGFVEPGETIEDAVRREVLEEVGLVVGPVAYVFSQPWPFPGSLMIGCVGEARPGPLTIQASELEDGRWFDREEVRAMVAGTHPEGLAIPSDFAIAHHLARRFCET